jgi:hypothetical protein
LGLAGKAFSKLSEGIAVAWLRMAPTAEDFAFQVAEFNKQCGLV